MGKNDGLQQGSRLGFGVVAGMEWKNPRLVAMLVGRAMLLPWRPWDWNLEGVKWKTGGELKRCPSF